MRKRIRHIFVICYMGFVVLLATGWYPEQQNKGLYDAIGGAGEETRKLLVMAENHALFEQGIQETGELERAECQQLDENYRRTVKAKRQRDKYQGILERIVEAEAGDQDLKGRVLVANVILNRVKSKEFPNTIKRVVFEPHQFSPISNGRYFSVHVSSLTKRAVQKALDGTDYSKGALYFMCRSASTPSNVAWFDRDLKRLFSYGCHEFFR